MIVSLALMDWAGLVVPSEGFGNPTVQPGVHRGVLLIGVWRSLHCTTWTPIHKGDME